jgi:hypothetical protein
MGSLFLAIAGAIKLLWKVAADDIDIVARGELGESRRDQIPIVPGGESGLSVGTMSSPSARIWPATDEAMQRREFVSMLPLPIKPVISLLAT